jgi:hypothetical protein
VFSLKQWTGRFSTKTLHWARSWATSILPPPHHSSVRPSWYHPSTSLSEMMINGATAQTGPWPPFTGFMIVFYSAMWGYQLHDQPVLDTLIQSSETSSSDYQRLSRRCRETRVRNGRWILPTNTYRARRVLLHAVNLRHGTDGFSSPPKEGVLRILPPLKSIILGRVWTREPWVQWQAR